MTHISSDDAVDRSAAEDSGPRRRPARGMLATVGAALVTLWGAATAAFVIQLAIPGDRATAILNVKTGQAQLRTPDELAPVISQFGLDDPLLLQYLRYLVGLARADLGTSYQTFRPVWQTIGEQLGSTLVLSVVAVAFAWIIMVVWVTLTAGRGLRIRSLGAAADTVAAGLPHYWLGVLLLLVFAVQLRWFPVLGGTSALSIVLPALALAIPLAGFMGQSVRAEFERALDQPFVLSARTRGMSDTGVRLRHVLRHAALPAVTLSGWAVGATISGAVVVESVYSRQGIGSVLVSAVSNRDLPVVTGVVVLVAFIYVVVNLLVDTAYTLLDPRLRVSR